MFCKDTHARTHTHARSETARSVLWVVLDSGDSSEFINAVLLDDGGFRGAAAQRGDGAAAAADRALPAASHRLWEPLWQHGHGSAGDGETADVRTASALPADQGQAPEQAPAAGGGERGPRGAERHGRRRGNRRGTRGRSKRDSRGAEQKQHADRGESMGNESRCLCRSDDWKVVGSNLTCVVDLLACYSRRTEVFCKLLCISGYTLF